MQCILIDRPTFGFECILKQITHMEIFIIIVKQGHDDITELVLKYLIGKNNSDKK